MTTFTVHAPPGWPDSGALELVEDGFSWAAFLFDVLWLLAHRMWIHGAAVALIGATLVALGVLEILDEGSVVVLVLALKLAVGAEAREWLREHLEHRGRRLHDVIIAEDADVARARLAARAGRA